MRAVAGSYVQSVFVDHFYRKTMKKVVRMMLFEVIQDCVDTIYFLEEDTIATANDLLEQVIEREVQAIAEQNLPSEEQDKQSNHSSEGNIQDSPVQQR